MAKVRTQEKEVKELRAAHSGEHQRDDKDDLPGVSSHAATANVLLSTPDTQTAAATAGSELGTPCMADSDVSSLKRLGIFRSLDGHFCETFYISYMYIFSFLGNHH